MTSLNSRIQPFSGLDSRCPQCGAAAAASTPTWRVRDGYIRASTDWLLRRCDNCDHAWPEVDPICPAPRYVAQF